MIRNDGWNRFSIWEHSQTVKDLYARRCEKKEEEMTCHVQAAELLKPFTAAGDSLLDVGCGSGYFYHTAASRLPGVEYHGIDSAPSLIAIGQRILPAHGLPAARLQVLRIEDLNAEVDHVACINVLSNIDNFHRPLERLLRSARKTVIVRESFHTTSSYSYVEDKYLDAGVSLKVHVNTYGRNEVEKLVQDCGFEAEWVTDRHSGGEPQMVIDHPHHWEFLVARRRS